MIFTQRHINHFIILLIAEFNRQFEQEERGDTIRQTCYLYGPEGMFAMVIRMDGTDSVRYCHKDHLGSVIAYSNELGNLVQELSYDAWGRRRDPATWDYLPSLAAAMVLDPHGFTGHEHLDLLEMVNMDGRMYDPVLGRFLSPDPLVQAPDFTQSLNRYAYCLNNPLSLCDPTGYSWFSDNWKSIVASVVGIAAAAFTGGASAGLTTAIIAGAAGGAAGAMVGAILNGQNFGQIVKSTLQGALFGAMSGALNFVCGDVSNIVARLAAHSVCDGFMEGIQGGNFLHGAAVGLLSAGNGEGMMVLGGSLKTGAQLAIQAVVGGTISELGGGNFANGAITAAFSFMFNHAFHAIHSHNDDSSVGVKIANEANRNVGSTKWGKSKKPFGPKCSAFVQDILTLLGLYEGPFRQAGVWGDSSVEIDGWVQVCYDEVQCGDIAAYKEKTSDASGHMGIMFYSNSKENWTLIYAGSSSHPEIVVKSLFFVPSLPGRKSWFEQHNWIFRRYVGKQ